MRLVSACRSAVIGPLMALYAVPFVSAKLQVSDLPKGVLDSEYAVRGEIVLRASEISKILAADPDKKGEGKKFPYDKLVPSNIGNPQAVGQKPLTYHRQVLSILTNTGQHSLVSNSTSVADLAAPSSMYAAYPPDVLQRGFDFAKAGNVGAYSDSKGVPLFRSMIAAYIDRRDAGVGAPKTDIEDLYITDGASPAVKTVLELMIRDEKDVILIPIPQYPLYSASIVRLGGQWVGYELQEDYRALVKVAGDKKRTTDYAAALSEGNLGDLGWKVDMAQLRATIAEQRRLGNRVRGIAVINPGNPTGNVLSEAAIEDIVRLAEKEDLAILADEVYQENVYNPNPTGAGHNSVKKKAFHSFRKVLYKLGSKAELFSFHSVSKGYYGECGLRGGYVHLDNIDQGVNEQLYKLLSMTLCSNTIGQAMMASVTNPPDSEGYLADARDSSVALFAREKDAILAALKQKAGLVFDKLNKIPGVQCMPIEGAMYAFPQIDLPSKFVAHAESKGKKPDTLYALELLENLGVIAVPGNGFGQRAGTFHLRLTILPQEEELLRVLQGFERFHLDIYEEFGWPEGVARTEL